MAQFTFVKVRLPVDLAAALAAQARRQRRTRSNYLLDVLQAHLHAAPSAAKAADDTSAEYSAFLASLLAVEILRLLLLDDPGALSRVVAAAEQKTAQVLRKR